MEGIRFVEVYNGGSRSGEDEASEKLAQDRGYVGIGGSDSHIVSHIGRCVTRFEASIQNEEELVSALQSGKFEAESWMSKR